jgi:DNA-binding CsgD family transcriptional regulator
LKSGAGESIESGPATDEDGRSRAGGVAAHRLFGREHDLRRALGLLEGTGARALILSGEPGIGKTALWRELLSQARGRGHEVLSAIPSGAEVQLTYAALGDLVDGLGPEALRRLAPPQRQALEVALLRAEGSPVDARAIGVALLEMLRSRAAQRPLVIGLDDLQWLDGSSARSVGFALRRLVDAPVTVVATLRSSGRDVDPALDLAAALGPERVKQLEIRSLTLAAIHELLVARFGVELPRSTLVAVFEAAGGNPFVAGELAQELVRRGVALEAGTPVPLPPSVRSLVQTRIERLAPEVQELMLAAGSLARPTLELLSRLRPDAAATLRAAADAGVIEPGLKRGEVRFTHPLLARVPYEALEPVQRRALHARLARVLDDLEERARHEALSAASPRAAVADDLDQAAAAAGARGAPIRAAELCTLAARLTPLPDNDVRGRRLLAAAHWHQRAGEIDRAADLADGLLTGAGARGETRAQALSLLATVRADTESVTAAIALYELGRREPGASAATRAEIHRRIAWLRLGGGEVAAAQRHARAARTLAAGLDPVAEAGAEAVGALAAVIAGEELPGGLPALAALATPTAVDTDPWPETSPPVVAAVALLWAGDIEQARPPLERALARATERDEPYLAMHALAYLSAIATVGGDLELGLRHARRYVDLAQETEQRPQRAAAQWPLAMAYAWLGDNGRTRGAAEEGLELARETGHVLYQVGCLAAIGLLELSSGRGPEAAEVLGRAWELASDSGIRALGRLPMLPDLIEALALAGRVETATTLSTELGRRAARLRAPWALALALRCEGLIAEAQGDPEGAVAAYRRALEQHTRQDRPPERARTELVLGRALRRARHKRAAREALERSVAGFESIGAELWAQRARQELSRIGGRRASPEGQLSATERSIAGLVAEGRTNQEVAVALHMSPRTVEWNLSKIYRKLGVRGRTELAAAVAAEMNGSRA